MPYKFSNSATATLSSSITSTTTSITIATGLGSLFPSLSAGESFRAVLVDSSNNVEIVSVTARSSDVMTVVRAQEGTTARAFSSGSRFEMRLTSAALTNFVQLDGAQTITGQKTFSQTIIGNLQGNVTGNVTGNLSGNATTASSCTGNAATVTNGVYTTGAQTIAGIKSFTSASNFNSFFVNGSAALGASVSGDALFTGGWTATSSSGRLYIGDGTGWSYYISRRVSSTTTDLFTFTDIGNFTAARDITAAGDITAYSDERLKHNWRDLDDLFLEDLANVQVGIYDRKDISETQVGVSAQSLRRVLPQAVREDASGYLSVAYGNAALAACVMLAQRLLAVEKKLGA